MPLRRLVDWYLPALAAALIAPLLAGGFALALGGRLGQPLAPLPARAVVPHSGGYRVVAVGDSMSEGVGDAAGGYAARVTAALRRRGGAIAFTNLATSGAETGEVLAAVGRAEAQRQIAGADLILVSAGGNDLSHALRALSGDPDAALARAGVNLATLVDELRATNPRAAIRLVGLYNPFEIAAGEGPQARAQLLAWNVAIERATLTYDDVMVVPVADLFAGHPDRLAGDRYHPGPRGHALIAERVLATLPE